jgi:hypothetical protein
VGHHPQLLAALALNAKRKKPAPRLAWLTGVDDLTIFIMKVKAIPV